MARNYLRKYPRKRVYIPVECNAAEARVETHAWAMGGGGLFLGISQNIPLGSELLVRFRPAAHLPMIEAKAAVRYALPGQGIGIEFIEITPEHRQIILLQVGQRMAESRRFPRAALAVQVEHEKGTLLGTSKDISVGGMFIESKAAAPASETLRVRFHLDNEGPIIVATAAVRYAVAGRGFGVQFTDLAPADKKRIGEYVAQAETKESGRGLVK